MGGETGGLDHSDDQNHQQQVEAGSLGVQDGDGQQTPDDDISANISAKQTSTTSNSLTKSQICLFVSYA